MSSTASPSTVSETINLKKWIEENKPNFVPPVCNKLMSGGQLKIMFVGGPNTRKDYHIDEGEEFFYMVKGDMCLKIMEQGKPKDIPIKEGEVFVLPCRIPHSPQRQENTIGLVIERERLPEEQDGLRYYCDDEKTILYEEWFHCTDLGTQLAPVIKRFFASEQYKTGKPVPGTILDEPPVKIDTTTTVMSPFLLKEWLKENADDIRNGEKELFERKGEFKVFAHGAGEQQGHHSGETWLMQIDGQADVTFDGHSRSLGGDDVLIIPSDVKYTVKRSDGSVGLSFIMDPMACK